jgi:hypothetical protein
MKEKDNSGIRNAESEIKNRFRYSNFAEVFGELQNVHRVRRSLSEKLLAPGVLLFLLVFGIITHLANRDVWTIPCCIVIPALLFSIVVWHLFTTRKDELRIYANGFTYQSGRKLQSCLWTEIETCTRREPNQRELIELAGKPNPLASVVKKNGESIAFEPDVPGTHEIAEKSKI